MNVYSIFEGSDGKATQALYARLEGLGPMGQIAMNLFRAQKCSGRAKAYRRRYKGEAYDRKQWSMDNLCREMTEHPPGWRWGWKRDPSQEFHCWVLYLELPTGQVSFHTAQRGVGPDYTGEWDGQREAVAGRVLRFVQQVLTHTEYEPD